MYYTYHSTFLILVLTLSCLLIPMPVESSPHPRFGGQLRYAVFQRVVTLDAINYLNFAELQIAANVYEGLVKRDRFGRTVSAIAQSWTHSEDYRVWTFTITQDAKFHDGTPVRAIDIKVAWERAVRESWLSAPELVSGMPLFAINGAMLHWDNRQNNTVEEIIGIRVLDERHLEVTLEQGDAAFLTKLTAPVAWITKPSGKGFPSHGKGILRLQKTIGTGRFRLASDSAEEIRLIANRAYPWGRPYLDAVTFRYYGKIRDALFDFESGNLDALHPPLAEVTAIRRDSIYNDAPHRSNHYDAPHHKRTFIQKTKAISVYLQVRALKENPFPDSPNSEARHGLNPRTFPELGVPNEFSPGNRIEWYDVLKYAIDVDALLRLQYGAELDGLKWEGNPFPDSPRFNPTKARRLLSSVGRKSLSRYAAQDDSRPLRLNYTPLPDNTGEAIATRLRRDFLKIGLQVATPNAMQQSFQNAQADLVLFACGREILFPIHRKIVGVGLVPTHHRKPSQSNRLIPLYHLSTNLLCHPYVQGVNIGWSGNLICDEVWLGK